MRSFLVVIGLFLFCTVTGQYKGPILPIQDKWFKKFGNKGLQEGDVMPDIPLGAIINNATGKKRFSDFRGKLVILDLWDTYCSSCIAGFPKMEKLQKEFGDQIQIILVNNRENASDIVQRTKDVKGFKMPDLPCVVSDHSFINGDDTHHHLSPLARLFPTVGVPHHVWIDKRGIVRLRGGSENTYAAKIRDFLAGKPIQFLKNNSTIPDLSRDGNARYYQQLGYMKHTPVRYASFITPYTNEVTGSYGAVREIVDSTTVTRISYFINQPLIELYGRCFNEEKAVVASSSKLLFFPSPSIYTAIGFTEFPTGIDTLDYTSAHIAMRRQPTTEEQMRNLYCYEQVLPLAVSKAERYQMMLEDLNRYFKAHYGMTGSVQNRAVKCYTLIRISDQDKVGMSRSSSEYHSEVVKDGAKALLNFQGALNELFPTWFRNENSQTPPGFLYDFDHHPFLVFNSTGWARNKPISLKIPLVGLQTIADMRRVLQVYDLDLAAQSDTLALNVFTRVDLSK